MTDNKVANNSRPKITFITGCSGAGKSTIVQELQHYVNDEQIIFLHFDSIGVPSEEEMIRDCGSGSAWQEKMTYKWVEDIISKYMNHHHVIIEGQVNIDFIRGAFAKFNVTNAHILLVHANNEIRHQRLKINRNQPELVNAEMDNWAKFLFNQAQNYNVEIIDTSVNPLEQTITNIQTIINI
jgi:dephospho-CoA kinase